MVKKGDTLYSIAWRYGLDYRQLAAWNNINKPFVISVNQKLFLTSVSAKKSNKNATKYKSPVSPANNQTKVVVETPTKFKSSGDWWWPTNGKVIKYFSTQYAQKEGIDIAGNLGQKIIASKAGKVVYSGSGLKGYGNLIIIKHDKNYFTAYAYNQQNLVKEEQQVKQGETIATMGVSPNKKPTLHFEIRYKGSPKNPLVFLKKN